MEKPYYKISTKGVYITKNAEPIDGQVTVLAPFPGRDECDFVWDSTWDRDKEFDNREVIYLDDKLGIRIPNVLIKPNEIDRDIAVLAKTANGDAMRFDFANRKLQGNESQWMVKAKEHGQI